jgi:hypothetical protein
VAVRKTAANLSAAFRPWPSLLGCRARWIANGSSVWYNRARAWFPTTTVGERRTTVEGKIGIQHWMVLAFLFYLDVTVLGCLFLIAMNKIYLLP